MREAGLFSFPKMRRLTRRSDFDLVKTGGRTTRGKLMVLKALAVENSATFRAGFVTSRRLGSAVVRNRVRRRFRELVRAHQHELRQDRWIVLTARRGAAGASYGALEDEWLRLAKRASILTI